MGGGEGQVADLLGHGPADLFDHQMGRQSGDETAVPLRLEVADLRGALKQESRKVH